MTENDPGPTTAIVCKECGEPANFHFTEIKSGSKLEEHFCAKCVINRVAGTTYQETVITTVRMNYLFQQWWKTFVETSERTSRYAVAAIAFQRGFMAGRTFDK